MLTRAFFLLFLASASVPAADTVDVVGPDGITYPNFKWAGVPGGIPEVPVVLKGEDANVVPDTQADSAPALQDALNQVSNGALLLPPGKFYLDSPVEIKESNVVLQGSGKGKTILVPRFANHQELKDQPLKALPLISIAGDRRGRQVAKLTEPAKRGATELKVDDANHFEAGQIVRIRTSVVPDRLRSKLPEVLAKKAEGFWGANLYMAQLKVADVPDDETVVLEQPIRSDLPLDTEPIVETSERLVERCGVEDLSIIQEEEFKGIHGIKLNRTSESWVKNVEVRNIGNGPLHVQQSRNFEIRGCYFDMAQAQGGGGVGYVLANFSNDGLFEDCEIVNLRHFSLQVGSNGNVVRKCRMENVDLNIHMHWPLENLVEQCEINAGPPDGDPHKSRGSYGFGVYSPRYHGDIHLPVGPRFVIYNNDIKSRFDSVVLGGLTTEEWIFAYNRFVANKAAAVLMKSNSNGNLFYKNVFALKDVDANRGYFDQFMIEEGREDDRAAVLFMSGPLEGNRFIGNTFTGVSEDRIFGGIADATYEAKDNQALATFEVPPRPVPPLPSLYEWQKAGAKASAAK